MGKADEMLLGHSQSVVNDRESVALYLAPLAKWSAEDLAWYPLAKRSSLGCLR